MGEQAYHHGPEGGAAQYVIEDEPQLRMKENVEDLPTLIGKRPARDQADQSEGKTPSKSLQTSYRHVKMVPRDISHLWNANDFSCEISFRLSVYLNCHNF